MDWVNACVSVDGFGAVSSVGAKHKYSHNHTRRPAGQNVQWALVVNNNTAQKTLQSRVTQEEGMKARLWCRFRWWWMWRLVTDIQWQHLRSTVKFVAFAATINIAAADCCWHIIHSTHNSATNFSRSTHGIWSDFDDSKAIGGLMFTFGTLEYFLMLYARVAFFQSRMRNFTWSPFSWSFSSFVARCSASDMSGNVRSDWFSSMIGITRRPETSM